MNRAQRRQAERTNRHPQHQTRRKPITKPWLHEVHLVFDPIDAVFDELRRGEVKCDGKGVPIFRGFDGVWYELAPALDGWADTWAGIARKRGLELDAEPLAKLSRKLGYGVILTPADVEAAYAVIERCRRIVMGADVYQLKADVRTQEIRMAMEDRGMVG